MAPDDEEVEIGYDELAARLDEPALVCVNVLARAAFDAARIPRSRHLPVARIPNDARRVLPDPAAETVVYCAGPD
ncbi:MAG: rhodanese-like domain-containing protein [Vicinamibacterales bacterium]